MPKSYRKALKSFNYDISDAVSVLWNTECKERYLRVDLTDETELDRRVELNLTLEEATYLANRLLQRVQVAMSDNARDEARNKA
jgi:hypothetical protein